MVQIHLSPPQIFKTAKCIAVLFSLILLNIFLIIIIYSYIQYKVIFFLQKELKIDTICQNYQSLY